MSRSKNGSVSSPASHQRLCHIVKREDFDGYGFNLHSEKGKPGQYIGKVDENSPAEQAGLRQGDRIIEVNGVNIGNETHKQVVQRIKAITNEVRLLVIDPSLEQNATITTSSNSKAVNDVPAATTAATVASTITIQSSTVHAETSPAPSQTTSSSRQEDDKVLPPGSISPTTSVKSELNSTASNVNLNNNNTISNSSSKSTEVDASIPPQLSSSSSPSPSSQQHQNGSTSTGANQQQKPSTGLNLPMTAAEMRAKLLAKKKYDPKNDSVDLRKKFDIIQKL